MTLSTESNMVVKRKHGSLSEQKPVVLVGNYGEKLGFLGLSTEKNTGVCGMPPVSLHIGNCTSLEKPVSIKIPQTKLLQLEAQLIKAQR